VQGGPIIGIADFAASVTTALCLTIQASLMPNGKSQMERTMHYRSPVSCVCLIGAGLVLCGEAHAAEDATAVCNVAISAYGAAAATGDPAKMAAVYAPEGEVVSPYGFVAGHDALVRMYASFMKPGDKEIDTATSARMIGDVALCTGCFTFTPASATSGEKGSWTKIVGKVGGEWKILNLTCAYAAPQ
jgi:ketosteroid isomerase-like protein